MFLKLNKSIEISFDKEFEKIKCLFITGGAGFIGSNFINMFATKYPHVNIINFDALYYNSNEDNIDKNIQQSKNYSYNHLKSLIY